MSEKEIDELINKIRGTTPSSELQKEVETLIKADEEKAKLKKEAADKLLDDIKKQEKLLKEKAIKEEKAKKEKKRDKTGKYLKTEPETPEENEEDEEEGEEQTNETIKNLTEQMAKLTEEIAALKKRKNYRTAPPAAEKVDEVDDFVKQNITKDFEMIV